jgi:hypothetical protein
MEKKLTNYGVLTDASKGWNMILGDKSGRTVSRRTTHGFQRSFNLQSMDENDAEVIVHGAMLASGALLRSKNDGAKAAGLLLLFGLFACYQSGK